MTAGRERRNHNAGLAGGGRSSYIDSVILRDRDANTAWEDEADGTLEERVYYCQNWRADVVALFGANGHMLHQVRYDPYGVPFGISKADINADGVLDSADSSLFVTLYNSGSGTHPFADWNLDGTLNSQDPIAYLNSYNADAALGYGVLGYAFSRAGGANRKGYAGYELAPELSSAKPCLYHVRHRVYDASLGRWTRRDPLGYVDGMSLYGFVGARPIVYTDPTDLSSVVRAAQTCIALAMTQIGTGGSPVVQITMLRAICSLATAAAIAAALDLDIFIIQQILDQIRPEHITLSNLPQTVPAGCGTCGGTSTGVH